MPVTGFGEISERLRRSTVHVSAGRRGQGSGVIIDPDGVIVTNAHVAAVGPVTVELWDGRRVHASLSARDRARDLAVLSLPLSQLPAAKLADSERLRVGELVIAVGNPMGFTGALTTGVIHAVGRVPGLGPMKWIQADVRLAPGNSGGPLANAAGQVVGINTMIALGVGLAVPSNTVSRLLKGWPPRAQFGVVARPVEVGIQGKVRFGLVLVDIIKNSPAERASLMMGDVVIAVDGCAFDAIEDLERVLEGGNERTMRLEFLRGDHTNIRAVTVRLGVRSMAAA